MPNQYSPGYVSQRDKVFAYVLEHPQSTANEIKTALGLPKSANIGSLLIRLYFEDRVVRDKRRGHRDVRWTAVEPEEKDEAPVQVSTNRWFGCPGRDPLVAALFGPAHSQEAA